MKHRSLSMGEGDRRVRLLMWKLHCYFLNEAPLPLHKEREMEDEAKAPHASL
jgi:hypothetical protein